MISELKYFTYNAYIKLLRLLRERYRIVPFCDSSKEHDSFLILRHDVDASLEAALKMARTEKDLEIRSTYFVLFSHKLYNLLEKDHLCRLKEISQLGHEIGLHYDVRVYKSYHRDLMETLETEVKLLESLLKRRVLSIACHDITTINSKDPFKDATAYINAYDPELCENYVSDSCRAWNLEDLSRLLSFRYRRVQLLIHPFLWMEDVCKRETVLERLFREIEKKNKDYKSKWLGVWNESQKVKNYDRLVGKSKVNLK